MKETGEHCQDPQDLDVQDAEIARADSIEEIFLEAADELAAMEMGRL